ncbi:di-heme oxidoredictase family protein [Hahella aquimaris]|uniref:di-heme oxidoreductase family protein n=1 Tax=Hahella sp. HNIBRBA332 TaxID=3015983 RepID=UPI00273B879E|nr:di-heme oxidoredictase family protein [Hahella sp. HNIBRBA332]WLQ11705.1 di-heme oxidoredictase family protein [Hahella sp. HNIBRBA332]
MKTKDSIMDKLLTTLLLLSGTAYAADPGDPREFTQTLQMNGGSAMLRFHSPQALNLRSPTERVYINYRINGSQIQVEELTETAAQTEFETQISGLNDGDRIEYYYTQVLDAQFAELPVDSGWFKYKVGEGFSKPAYPLTFTFGGRFRDRHEGEGRFDHYVAGYTSGTSYIATFKDWGNRLEMTVVTDDPTDNSDIRWSDHIGVPDPLNKQDVCYRAEFDKGGDMEQVNANTWRYVINDVTEGQLIDLEWTFKRASTDQQYYNDIFRIRIGEGHLSQERQHPYFSPGGSTTPNIIQDKQFLFAQHLVNIGGQEMKDFLAGKTLFDTDFGESNPDIALHAPQTKYDCIGDQPSPKQYIDFPQRARTPVTLANQLGPQFNNSSCFACHTNDGRGTPPEPGQPMQSMLLALSVEGTDAHGGPAPHPTYGSQLQDKSVNGGSGEGQASVTYQSITRNHIGGGTYTLHKPIYDWTLDAPINSGDILFSPRIAPQLTGMGLIDAISDATILAFTDPDDANGDGISGKANYVWDRQSQSMRLGKYGWKAGQPSVLQQTAKAAHEDMGIANPIFGNGAEFSMEDLHKIESYVRHLAVPPNLEFFADEASQASKLRGKALFKEANCSGCHIPTMTTSSDFEVASLRNQVIQPFSDFLLHDMGPDLADNRPEYAATGYEWRTPPLWAIGHFAEVNGNARYLHDGRATSIEEAIMWHGGEAAASRDAFSAMSSSEREDLIAYTRFPFVDPVADGGPAVKTPSASIVSPTQGSQVERDVELAFTLRNWEMNVDGRHLHWFVDGVDQGERYDASPITISELSDGEHTIAVKLANADHQFVGGAQVNVKVGGDAPGPDPQPQGITKNADGSVTYAITFAGKMERVQLFVEKNGGPGYFWAPLLKADGGLQNGAQETANSDGSYRYSITHPASHYGPAQTLRHRFYAYSPAAGQLFQPGPGDALGEVFNY